MDNKDNTLFSNYDNNIFNYSEDGNEVDEIINRINFVSINQQPLVMDSSEINFFDHNRVEEIKRKEKNNSPVVFSDGLDDDIYYRKGIRKIFNRWRG